MGKLSDIAKKALGNQAVKLDDIVAQYGGVVTVNGLHYANIKGDEIPAFSFVEEEGTSFLGGCKKLKELATDLIEAYGDLQKVNEEFQHTGLKIKIFPQTKTAAGKSFRPVTVLGEVELDALPVVNNETGEIIDEPEVAPF